MSEEMKKQETMEDYMKEIDASFSDFRDDDMLIWDKLEQMKEDKTEFEVSVEGIVKGGAIAYVEGIRAFIPVSKLALNYVENPEDYLKKTITVRVFEVDEQENRLVLSAKEILKEKADAEKRSDPIERRCRDSGKMGRSAGRLHGRRYQCLGLPCRKRDDPRPGHVSHRRAGRRMDEYLAAECDGDGRELFGKGRYAHGRIRHRRFHGYDSAPEACGGLQYDPELQRREYLDHA